MRNNCEGHRLALKMPITCRDREATPYPQPWWLGSRKPTLILSTSTSRLPIPPAAHNPLFKPLRTLDSSIFPLGMSAAFPFYSLYSQSTMWGSEQVRVQQTQRRSGALRTWGPHKMIESKKGQ